MGLKDLKSDLTSLDYPDGGAWGGGPVQRPLMTKPLIDFSGNVGGIVDIATGGLIRGGAATHVERNLTDVARIGKFLITPKGLNFITKQVGLQASNPKISAPHNKFQWSDLLNPPASNQRTYNFGINTLASVAAGSTTSGLFLKREGLIPTSYKGYVDDIDKIEKKDTNRLVYLFNNKIIG